MSGSQYCGLCHRWYYITYASHNAQHIKTDPHAFCRTMDCGQPGCPVPLNKAEDERITEMLRDRYPGYLYDGRDGSIEEEDDEGRIAAEDAAREGWQDYLAWQRESH